MTKTSKNNTMNKGKSKLKNSRPYLPTFRRCFPEYEWWKITLICIALMIASAIGCAIVLGVLYLFGVNITAQTLVKYCIAIPIGTMATILISCLIVNLIEYGVNILATKGGKEYCPPDDHSDPYDWMKDNY